MARKLAALVSAADRAKEVAVGMVGEGVRVRTRGVGMFVLGRLGHI